MCFINGCGDSLGNDYLLAFLLRTKTKRNYMFEQTFKNIDDVLWKEAGCSSELDYTEQTSWMLFLKYLDDLEAERAIEDELGGKRHHFIVDELFSYLKGFRQCVSSSNTRLVKFSVRSKTSSRAVIPCVMHWN